jgi:hypothetical protein
MEIVTVIVIVDLEVDSRNDRRWRMGIGKWRWWQSLFNIWSEKHEVEEQMRSR